RERDYIYVGSYYVFAFWIGLGILPLINFTKKYIPVKMASMAVFIICLILVPGIMAQQEWDDHDRSQKTLPLELAHNYLESCPPNALLMSYGDNDTYPLWYAQEVEGIRPDVRVVVNSLFSTDWYTNELRYKVNNSAPFDLIFTKEQFLGNKRQAIYFNENAGYDKNKFYPIDSIFKNFIANDELSVVQQNNGDALYSFPSKKFILAVNKENAVKAGVINSNENTLPNIFIEYAAARTYMTKNDIALYSILATNQWKRPICFTSLQELDELGLMKYTRKRGLIHILVPMENADFDLENTYNLFMNKFIYSNGKNKNIYYDEENRRHLENMRLVAGQFASFLVERGLKDSARKFLNYMDNNLDSKYFPYGLTCNRGNQHDYFSMLFLEACYKAGDSILINKISKSLKKDLEQQLKYYKSLGENQTDEAFSQKLQQAYQNKTSADLSKKQLELVQDALTTVQILEQIKQMENNYKESIDKALLAFEKNEENKGPQQNSDIYNALSLNWSKTVNNKNVLQFHKFPIRSLITKPNSDIVISGDESGTILISKSTEGILIPINSFSVKNEIRSLSLSPNGQNLLVLSSNGVGYMYGFDDEKKQFPLLFNFNFDGIAKAAAFVNNNDLLLITNMGLQKLAIENKTIKILEKIKGNEFSCILIGKKSHRTYIASGSEIKIYDVNQTLSQKPILQYALNSKITSLDIDENEKLLASGSIDGSIWLKDLSTNKAPIALTIHQSSVNDLQFGKQDGNNLQLASASADNLVKLIDVYSVLSGRNNEDMFTLRGHNLWVYKLCFLSNGKYLFSASEDQRMISWIPSMSDVKN
ncbi:MAG: hypothetical protein ORN58_02490, partial [Sediminibacterium sp.]|nr:hypothetical protein [Sediminibacterium sp.]